ncbi:MAG: methylated-DNA--[protein]-cysteine S-methyltransferase [Verrucomicrobiota bacterium]
MPARKQQPAHATASRIIDSPVGSLVLLASPAGLAGLFFGHRLEDKSTLPPEESRNTILDQATRQLEEYFAQERETFELPLDPAGTPFREQVWLELRKIPYGQTLSYGELARKIDNPAAIRAVGTANGANPISIIVPCHRVIGADGSLTGFGGGLEIKRRLLEHEGALLAVG